MVLMSSYFMLVHFYSIARAFKAVSVNLSVGNLRRGVDQTEEMVRGHVLRGRE